MRRFRKASILGVLWLLSATAQASLLKLAEEAPLLPEDGGFRSAIIDTTNGKAYFGSSTTYNLGFYSPVTTVDLSPFDINLVGLGYFPSVTNLSAAVFDDVTGYGFFASSQTRPSVEMTPIHAPATLTSSVTFSTGEGAVGTAVIDTTNHFAYFGTHTAPSVIIKVRLPDGATFTDMTIVSSLTLPSGLEFLSASVIDVAGGFAYFGSNTTTGAVAKIRLSNFTVAATLTFNTGEGGVASAVIDPANNFAYFGTHDSPGKIVKVRLLNLTRASARALPNGENDLTSAMIDTSRAFAYFGTNTSPGIIVPIWLSDFTHKTSLTLGTGDDYLKSAVIDTTSGYGYFGTFTTPGKVLQIDLIAGAPEILANPTDSIAHVGETAFFIVAADGRSITYQWQMNGTDIPGATSAIYSHVVSPTDDGASFRCAVTNGNGTTYSSAGVLTVLPVIRVYPNPWRSDRHTGIDIQFNGVLAGSTIKIFNLAAHWVKTLAPGVNTWDLTNDAGQKVASGYYFYIVTARDDDQTVKGKIAIIR